jgi:probable F420-dependent oxidoreductase
MGFDIISASDHIVIPKGISSRYPYSATGLFGDAIEYLELLTTLTFVASQTSRARLLTAVMVLPHRSPVLTAKILATLDVLSKGRLDVGCGVGWMREEFEAIGAPPYEERGAVSDEYIQAFKELWTSDNPTFNGKFCRFSDIAFFPKPVQKPHPPIWIGGESTPALRRAARLGDVWFPIGYNPKYPVATLKQLSEYIARVRRYAGEAGRNPADIAIAYSGLMYSEGEAQTLPTGERRILTGTSKQIAGDIKAMKELGVSYLMFNFFQSNTVEGTLARMEQFITKVKPLAGG